jgi:hypothetical protein
VSIILREDWNVDIDEVAQSLMAVEAALSDIELPLLASRRIAMQDMDDRFTTQTDPDGNEWVPLTIDYLNSTTKSSSEHPDDILQLTGAMREAATNQESWLITDNSLIFDSSSMPFYAMIHQEGSDPFGAAGYFNEHGEHVEAESQRFVAQGGFGPGRGNALPQRKWIGISAEGEVKMEAVFDLWFDEATSIAVQPATALFPGMVQHRLPSGRFGSQIEV